MNLSFDDILIVPKYSEVVSRKDVSTKTSFLGQDIFPVISSNMDSVTGVDMATAMYDFGAMSCLHRFQSIEDNVKQYLEVADSNRMCYVSIGLGEHELERAKALREVGALHFVLDVAHGASKGVVDQVKALRKLFGNTIYIVAGNFATKQSLQDFLEHLGDAHVDAIKVGIGGGSACTTRMVTGCGIPTFASIVDCSSLGIPIIADGGIRSSGDVAKALAAGASAVMLGRMLAGSDESPGEKVFSHNEEGYFNGNRVYKPICVKPYRGSASLDSYKVQDKESSHRTPEGESMFVPYTGPVVNTLQQIEAGLRSAMSYVGAHTLKEFKEKAQFVQITNAGITEGKAHGKL